MPAQRPSRSGKQPRRRPAWDDEADELLTASDNGTGVPGAGTSGAGTSHTIASLTDPDPDPVPGQRPSTWGHGQLGPHPRPRWLETRTAAKRYRSAEHRTFHRGAEYLDGRRMRRSREMRAIANRTRFGHELIAQRWAAAEFQVLSTLWQSGVAVPYPVQLVGTELLCEFIGHGREAAPRLADLRPGRAQLLDLWHQLDEAVTVLAEHGWAHGDLSAFNLLVDRGRLVLIDLPQVVDLVANPYGGDYLARDITTVCRWFAARGLPQELADAEQVTAGLLRLAR